MRGVLFILLAAVLGAIAAPMSAQVSLPGPSPAAEIPGVGTKQETPLVSHMPTTGNAGITDSNYRLGSGDKMKITVYYGEDDLSGGPPRARLL
jgi:protein involved in polysaccharide export with SLBB domain